MNIKIIPRWIAVPVAAVATYMLTLSVLFVLYLLQSKIFGLELDKSGVFLNLIAPALAVYLMVLVSWYIAPAHKKITALIVYVLFVFIAGVSFAMEMIASADLWRVLNIVVQIAAGGYALWSVNKQEVKDAQKPAL